VAPADLRTYEAGQTLSAMEGARERTLALVDGVPAADMNRVISPIMSPLAWDLGHIAAYEDLWLGQRRGGLELLEPELAVVYDAFETPRAERGDAEVLDAEGAVEYLARVRERTRELALAADGAADEYWEMVLRHELQHCETMRQTMDIGGLLPAGEPALDGAPAPLRWRVIEAGPFTMGAGDERFAYDNERPAHARELAGFAIASRPASNGEWLVFGADGGYERRELWSEEGWSWRCEQQVSAHPGIASGAPDAAACHVSWHEAQAFARYSDARLPTEAEWEKAARNEPSTDEASSWGALERCGQVWEWTGSHFNGYAGFIAHPYPEYSEVFFGAHYRVLRGASWATDRRVAGRTFRNWDLPIRRQIFSGVRLARGA